MPAWGRRERGAFNLKVSFTQPGVTVMTAFFNLPQPWFRVRDKLRDRA